MEFNVKPYLMEITIRIRISKRRIIYKNETHKPVILAEE